MRNWSPDYLLIGVHKREVKTTNMKYYASELGPAIKLIVGVARFIAIMGRTFVQAPWVAAILLLVSVGVAFAVWYVRDRMRNEKDAPTQEVASIESPIPGGKSANIRCYRCQHVQTVPVSSSTFECEQCNAKLKRRVGTKEDT
jgi:hypothetical protein